MKGGYCVKGDICNFIHVEKYRGFDVPREELFRIRAENITKYSTLLNKT